MAHWSVELLVIVIVNIPVNAFLPAEPQRSPATRGAGSGRLLGHAAALHREHQPEVRRATPAQGKQLETPRPP